MVYCFWHSGESAEFSDLQLTFTPASYKEGVQGQLEDEPGMTVASWQQRPESRGYVRIRSNDPFAPPIIQTNYLDAELDRRVIVGGMKLARNLLKSAPLSPYYAYEDFPGPNINTDDEFLAAATERGTTTFHPGCTCRMGPADSHLGGGRRPAPRPRAGGSARHRRLGDAAHDLGEFQCLHHDDRGPCLGSHPRQGADGSRAHAGCGGGVRQTMQFVHVAVPALCHCASAGGSRPEGRTVDQMRPRTANACYSPLRGHCQ